MESGSGMAYHPKEKPLLWYQIWCIFEGLKEN